MTIEIDGIRHVGCPRKTWWDLYRRRKSIIIIKSSTGYPMSHVYLENGF